LSNANAIQVDQDGKAQVSITSTTQGTVNVTAQVIETGQSTVNVTKPVDHLELTFGTSSTDPARSWYTLSEGDKTANGQATHQIVVSLRDNLDGRIHGEANNISVTLTPRSGDASHVAVLGAWTEGTNPATSYGDYTADITSTFADTYDVTVNVGGLVPAQPSNRTSVTFVPGPPSATNTTYEVTTGTRIADGTDAHTVTVLIRDANNNPISQLQGSLTGQAAPATVSSFSEVTPGTYTAPVTATRAGSRTVTVNLAGLGSALDSHGANRVAVFVAGVPNTAKSTLTRLTSNPQLVTAGSHQLRVTLLDAEDNPVPDTVVTFRTSPALTLANGGVVTTGTDGVATLPAFTTDTPGTYTAYAEVQVGGSTIQPSGSGTVQAVFENGPIDTTKSWFAVSQNTDVVADGDSDHFQLLTVRLEDASGTGIAGQLAALTNSVTFQPNPTNPGPSALPFTEVAGDPGSYQAKLVSTKSGDFKVLVTANQNGSKPLLKKTGDNDIASFVAGVGVPTSVLSANPLTLKVAQTSTASVAVVDAQGNPVPNQLVHFWTTPTLSVGSATSTEATVRSNSTTGVATVPLTTTTAGAYRVFAALVDNSGEVELANSGQVTVTFEADRDNPDWTKTTLTGTTGQTRVANGTQYHEAEVLVKDSYDNVIPGLTVTFANSGVGAPRTGSSYTGTTDVDGKLKLELVSTVADFAHIRATVTVGTTAHDVLAAGSSSAAQLDLEFVPGTPVWEGGNSFFVVSTGTKIADGTEAHTITVTVRDADGNGVPGQKDAIAAAAAPAAGVIISSFTPGSTRGVYEATIRSTQIGVKTVTVTGDGHTVDVGTPGRDTAEFVAGTPDPTGHSHFEVSTTPDVIADADPANFQEVTLYLNDTHGNPVSGLAARLSGTAVSQSGAVTANVSGFTATATPGVYTAKVTATKALTYVVTTSYRNDDGSQVAIGHTDLQATPNVVYNDLATFVPGAVSTDKSALEVSLGEVVVGGNHWAKVTVLDAQENPVPGVAVEFWTNGPNGHDPLTIANSGQAITGANGQAQVNLTTHVADTYTVFAKIVDLNAEVHYSGQRAVKFVAGVIDGQHSSLSVPTEGVSPDRIANGTDRHTIQLVVRDSDDNPVVGAGLDASLVQIRVVGPTGETQTLTPTTVTNASGVLTVPLSATVAGVYTVTATIMVQGASQTVRPDPADPAVATFVPGPASLSVSDLTVDKTKAAVQPASVADQAANKDRVVVTVTLRDAQGNLLGAAGAGLAVSLPVTIGAVSTVTDHGDGSYTAVWTSNRAGNGNIRLAIGADNATSSKAVKFIAKPSTPSVDVVNDTKVEGEGEPGDTVVVEDNNGNELCRTVVDSHGHYTCEPLTPKPSDGDEIHVTVTEPDGGFTSDPIDVIVDARPPQPPVVNPSNPDVITGTVTDPEDIGSTVTVEDGDGNTLCTTTVQPDMSFSCGPLVPKPGDGDHVIVTVTDPNDNTSDPTDVVIDGRPPKVDAEESDGSVIYGTSDEPGTITVVDNTNRPVCTAVVQPNGSWSCTPDHPLDDGEVIHITATDPSGNHSTDKTITIDQSQLPPPLIDNTNGELITGKGRPGATVVVTFPDNSEATTVVDRDGNWKVNPPASYYPHDGDNLVAHQEEPFNQAGPKVSPNATQRVDREAPSVPVPNPSDGVTVTGKADPGSSITITDANGKVIGTAVAEPDGRWTARLNPEAKEGDLVTITATDSAGNTSGPATLRIGLLRITVDKKLVFTLEEQTVRVYNLQPGEKVTAVMNSEPLQLGSMIADKDGQAVYTWKIPANFEAGSHSVTATGDFSGVVTSEQFSIQPQQPPVTPFTDIVTPKVTITATPTVKVTAQAVPGYTTHPDTGAEGMVPALGGALGALLAGLFLVLAAARRRRQVEEM
jgi:adhesin/invasin